MLGGFGAVLPDPLGDVLDGVPMSYRLDDLRDRSGIAVELCQQGQLIQGELTGQLTGGGAGLGGDPAGLQGCLDRSALRPVDLRSRVLVAPASLGGEQRRGLFDRREVLAVAVAVGDQHVQVLARLIIGPAGIQVAGHLGQPGLDGCGQAAMSFDNPVAPAIVRGDQQRYPHADRQRPRRRTPCSGPGPRGRCLDARRAD